MERPALCKSKQQHVRADGGCLACEADCGEACRATGKSIKCTSCDGHGMVAPCNECSDCAGSGRNWVYPSGLIVKWYGGPIIGHEEVTVG